MPLTITLPPMDDDQDYWFISDGESMVFRVNPNGVVEEIETEAVEDWGEMVIPVRNWTNH